MGNALKEYASVTMDIRLTIKILMNASPTVRMAVRTDSASDPMSANVPKVALHNLLYVRNNLSIFFFKTGYVQDHRNNCLPHCRLPCMNGFCAEPNQCQCHQGYVNETAPNVCEPQCQPPCLNGICISPNQCQCLPGYLSLFDRNICTRICDPMCEFGKCMDGKCVCLKGFELAAGSDYICEPHCDVGCVNGTCSEPNVCTCAQGHALKLIESQHHCIRYCDSSCENGMCLDGTICTYDLTNVCMDGYILVEEQCQPHCVNGCPHGKCVRPNTCQCFEGKLPRIKRNIENIVILLICRISCRQ